MEKTRRATSWCLLLLLISGCFRQEILTAEVNIPQLRAKECQQWVLDALDKLGPDAIIQADLDRERRTARILYDSRKVALKNIEYAITDAGFDANDEKARPEARAALPPACR